MYSELVKRLRHPWEDSGLISELTNSAADAIEELSAKVDSLQLYVDDISKLPDCNTCLKNGMCEFRPKPGEYCRINCPEWLRIPEPPKEE